jgi:hypothetical protein
MYNLQSLSCTLWLAIFFQTLCTAHMIWPSPGIARLILINNGQAHASAHILANFYRHFVQHVTHIWPTSAHSSSSSYYFTSLRLLGGGEGKLFWPSFPPLYTLLVRLLLGNFLQAVCNTHALSVYVLSFIARHISIFCCWRFFSDTLYGEHVLTFFFRHPV